MPRTHTPRPCDWLQNPRSFGTEEAPRWRTDAVSDPSDAVMLQTAQLQHVLMLTLTRMHPGLSWRKVADDLGVVSYAQIRRIAAGHAHMSLRDLVMLSHEYGPLLVLGQEAQDLVGARGNGWLFRTKADADDDV